MFGVKTSATGTPSVHVTQAVAAGDTIIHWEPCKHDSAALLETIRAVTDCAKITEYDGTPKDLINRVVVYNRVAESRMNVLIQRIYDNGYIKQINVIADRNLVPGEELFQRRSVVEWLHIMWGDRKRSSTSRGILRQVIEVFAADDSDEHAAMDMMDELYKVPAFLRGIETVRLNRNEQIHDAEFPSSPKIASTTGITETTPSSDDQS